VELDHSDGDLVQSAAELLNDKRRKRLVKVLAFVTSEQLDIQAHMPACSR
jgi:hypothetical protein